MRHVSFLALVLIALCAPLCAQNNPNPLVYQPLVPASSAPGASGFTLTVSGTGFATGAVLNWNGSPRTTTVLSSSSLQATISSSDVAHLGTASVTVVNPAPGGGTSNVVYFPVRRPAAAVAFAPEPGVSPLAGAAVVGDFNGDGILDLVVGQNFNNQTGSLSFYRGLGNGTFAAPVTSASTLPVFSLMAGDFNNDGKLDVVIGTFDPNAFQAEAVPFLNTGTGHFVQKAPVGSGDDGWLSGVADVNGDGNLDILFEGEAEGTGAVEVFLGNGTGTFTYKSEAYQNNYDAAPIGIGDFNGDGKLDMAVTDFDQIDIYLGNGDGTFQPFVPYSCYPCGGSITAADLTGDGKLDLIVGELTVLLGNGDGTFTPGFAYSPSGSGFNAVGDFNGDGKLDVLTVGFNVSVFLGNGDGTFQNPTTSGSFTTGGTVAAFGDFNRDGQLDVVNWGNPSDQIGLQTTLGLTPSSLGFSSIKIGSTSKSQTVTLTNVSSHSLPISSIALTGADPGDFIEHNTCGAGLRAGATCTISVAFKPTVTGTLTASVSISYTGLDSPQTVSLSGYGF
jgi:VCBS repeat protein/centrosomal CEP192-like protein